MADLGLSCVPLPDSPDARDAVQTAIVQTQTQPIQPTPRPTHHPHTRRRIPQAFVGEVTASISGHVYCYGYAVHEGVCILLNIGVPRMAVEAIWAKLGKGDTVSVTPWDGLSPGFMSLLPANS
ncbi:MAG: hypothetical protein HC794_09480 [Nitrospiraceae bacterium]|nr:hypothetical protein [Nitrospiraceae bacterium]